MNAPSIGQQSFWSQDGSYGSWRLKLQAETVLQIFTEDVDRSNGDIEEIDLKGGHKPLWGPGLQGNALYPRRWGRAAQLTHRGYDARIRNKSDNSCQNVTKKHEPSSIAQGTDWWGPSRLQHYNMHTTHIMAPVSYRAH